MVKLKKGDIFTIHHKPHSMLAYFNEYSEILQVGSIRNEKFSLVNDAVDPTMSGLNYCYAELSGIYTVWKYHKRDRVCFQHYRRIFDYAPAYKQTIDMVKLRALEQRAKFREITFQYGGAVPTDDVTQFKAKFKNLHQFDLKPGSVIIPTPLRISDSVQRQFIRAHNKVFWDVTFKVLRENNTNLAKAFERVGDQNKLIPYNMFIMNWIDFDAYCSTVFPIFEKIYHLIDKNLLQGYNSRFIGFIAERVFSAYIFMKSNELKIEFSPVSYADFDL